ETLLQYLLSEREQTPHRLASLTTIAERLYPDTATVGREKLRKELRELRDRWEHLDSSINEQQRKQEAASHQWSSFEDSLKAATNWLDSNEKLTVLDLSGCSSLPDIKSKLLKMKSLLQDITCHKRALDNVSERSSYLLQSNPTNKEVQEAVKDIESRHETLAVTTRKSIEELEWLTDSLNSHNDLTEGHADWQKDMWEKLHALTDYSGNKSVLTSRLASVRELEEAKTDGRNMILQITSHSHQLIDKLPSRAKENMERENNNLKYELAKFASTLADVKHGLEERLQQWTEYEGTFDRILTWLNESEATLKKFGPKNSLQEKQEQLERFQEFLRVIESRHVLVQELIAIADNLEQGLVLSTLQQGGEAERLSEASSDLQASHQDTRITYNVQQVTSRFKALQATAKDLLKKCEAGVADHHTFVEKYNASVSWLTVAQDKLAKVSEIQGNRSTLSKRSQILNELLAEKINALQLVNVTVELGEKLYTSTAEDGREAIRIQMDDLQTATDSLFDTCANSDRDLQATTTRWQSYEEAGDNLKSWLKKTQSQLPDEIEFKTTLDEKKAQLQTY
ncbi:unnamed protein product, partial [Meganyctiphanes norvegica]